MAEKIIVDVEIKDNVKSLKAQLREAQAEVTALSEKFGATSKEATEAAKKAAKLKDAIGDAKALTDAYNPDAKFNALTQSLTGVLNGFQAFEGALGLVGVEGEAVQETLLKVQSAMALAEGVSGVLESVDSFKTLATQIGNLSVVQKVSTAAQWLWNAAMNANPIGAITIAITALLAVGYKLVDWFMDSAEANEKAMKSVDKHSKAVENQNKQLTQTANKLESANKFQYDYAKASGKSAEELRKLALKHAQEELALARKNKELAKATYLREADILAAYRANGASEEVIKAQVEVVKKAKESAVQLRETAQKEAQELLALQRQQQIEIRQEQTDAARERQEREKEEAERRREQQKENREKERQDAKEDAAKAEQDRNEQAEKERLAEEQRIQTIANAKKDARKAELDAQNDFILQKENAENDYLESLLSDQDKEVRAVQDKYFELIQNAIKYGEDTTILEEARQAELDAIKTKYNKKEEEDQKALQEAKINMASDAINIIADLIEVTSSKSEKEQKKVFKVQKAAAIASATIDTYKGAVSAYASTPGGPILKGIAAALAVAAGIANIKKISATQFEGGTTPSNDQNQETPPSPTAAPTPANFNIVGNAGANPLAGLNQPIQAYVVSGQVTTAQEMERNTYDYATFG